MNKTKDQQAQEYAKKKMENVYSQEWDSEYVEGLIESAFEDGYTACEQSMTDGEAPVIQRWVARDRDDNSLWMYAEKPLRDGNVMWYGKEPIALPTDFFPFLTWSDEPIKCEFLIKPKNR